MQTMDILFGFDDPQMESVIVSQLRDMGIKANISIKISKSSIRDFLCSEKKCDAAVLLEVMGTSKDERVGAFSAEELAELTDERDVNLVVVVDEKKKGTEDMQILYGAGITSAVFDYGRRGGPTLKDVTNLIVKKRTRKEARAYYGMTEYVEEIDFLSEETFVACFNMLYSDKLGGSSIERFSHICALLNKSQIADFVRRLPAEMIKELGKYQEFHTICSLLKDSNIPFSVHKPKKVMKGYERGYVINEDGQIEREILEHTNISLEKKEIEEPVREESTGKKKVVPAILFVVGLVTVFAGLYLSGLLNVIM